MPAIASTHAALRRSSSRSSAIPRVEPLARALGLEAHQRRQPLALLDLGRACSGIRRGGGAREHGQQLGRDLALRRTRIPAEHAEAPQVLARQVHPPVLRVLAHVAQDVRQLHRHAEFVGERSASAGAASRPARRPKIARHTRPIAPATRRQYTTSLEALVAVPDVHPHPLDQLAERSGRQREARWASASATITGSAPGASPDRCERAGLALEQPQLLLASRARRRRCRRRVARTRTPRTSRAGARRAAA